MILHSETCMCAVVMLNFELELLFTVDSLPQCIRRTEYECLYSCLSGCLRN